MSVLSNSITYSFGGAFSMGSSKRQELQSPNSTPGPGSYNHDLVKINSPRQPQHIIPQSPRKPIYQEKGVPPPGSYDVKEAMGSGQKISISKMRYKDFGDQNELGPGSYEVNKAFISNQSSPQFSFSSRYDDIKSSFHTPGPGTYNMPDSVKIKSNANRSTISLSHSDSKHKIKSEEVYTPQKNPGPGEYYQESIFKNNLGTTFARSGRMMMKLNNTPGPGHFNLPEFIKDSKKNFTLGSKLETKDTYKSKVPGPGTYDLTNKLRKPNIKMGLSLRKDIAQSDTPGPGSYKISTYSKDDSFASNSPDKYANQQYKYSNRGLGYSRRPDIIQNKQSPGPGNYNLPEYIGKSTQVKISTNNNKGKWKVISENPGPGSYNINSGIKDSTKGIKISDKHFYTEQSQKIPGPGSYDLSYSSMSPKFSFTQEKRTKQDIRSLFEPSPGQYEIAGSIANVPSYLQKRA